jgi:hypothetical protein
VEAIVNPDIAAVAAAAGVVDTEAGGADSVVEAEV